MLKKPKCTMFKFILSNEDLMNNLDNIKMNNFDKFIKIGEMGKQIQQLAKANEHEQISQICDQNMFDIMFMKMEIDDAFVSAFNLRNFQTIKYFLQNGFQIQTVIPDSVPSICYSLEYLAHDPPTQILQLILEYGANPRYAEESESNTGMHLACQYGNLDFVKLLVTFGADINAVNDSKQTPLGCARAKKKADLIQYLKQHKAAEKWNE